MDGYITIGTNLNSSMIDKQISLLEDKLQGLVEEYEILEKSEPFEGQNKELIKLGKEIETTRKKIASLRKEQTSMDFSNIGNSVQKVTTKIGRMIIAVFGIRSAFMFVRSAINTIASDDEQLKADIDYMRNALAYTLEPVVRGIVNLMKQLMYYVAYIVKAWTGKNIFANANKGLNQAVGSAKELNKQLAGFDEMNVLNDSSSGGGGGVAPSFDLTSPEDVDVPKWIRFIAENKELIIGALAGITTGLIAMKLGAEGIMATGLGVFIGGLVLLWQDFNKMLEDGKISGDEVIKVLTDIGVIIGGLMIISGNWFGLLVSGIALILRLIVENWDTIKGVLGKVGDWINQHIIQPIGNFFKNLFNGIINGTSNAVNKIFNFFSSIPGFFNDIINKVMGFFRNLGVSAGNVIGGAFKGVINGVLNAIENILNFPIRTINSLIRTINKVPGINLGTLSTFNLPRLAKGGIINMPGRGVPVGSAIGGERGAEGVIPLTDSQQMALLGEAIGKYITINANITNTMNGRVISRELQKIQNENDFAFNK